jgi:hypothetical protein
VSSSDDDDSEEDATSILQITENETIVRDRAVVAGVMNWEIIDLRREVATLKRELSRTKSELKTAKSVIRTARSRQRKEVRLEKPAGTSNANYVSNLLNGFLSLFASARSRKKKKALAKQFFVCLNEDTIFGEMIVEYGKEFFRNNVFDPFSVLCLMDLEGGKLKYKASGLLCQLETNGKKHMRNTLIPSVGELKKAAKLVEELGTYIAPFTSGVTDKGAEKVRNRIRRGGEKCRCFN